MLSRACRTFYHDSPKDTPLLPVLRLPHTEEIYSHSQLQDYLLPGKLSNPQHGQRQSSLCLEGWHLTASCDRQYFGETGINLIKRLSQRKYDISGDLTTTLSSAIYEIQAIRYTARIVFLFR